MYTSLQLSAMHGTVNIILNIYISPQLVKDDDQCVRSATYGTLPSPAQKRTGDDVKNSNPLF